ncbi:MAG: hypothetical protein Q9200_006274 [Gallowayella weberi]
MVKSGEQIMCTSLASILSVNIVQGRMSSLREMLEVMEAILVNAGHMADPQWNYLRDDLRCAIASGTTGRVAVGKEGDGRQRDKSRDEAQQLRKLNLHRQKIG